MRLSWPRSSNVALTSAIETLFAPRGWCPCASFSPTPFNRRQARGSEPLSRPCGTRVRRSSVLIGDIEEWRIDMTSEEMKVYVRRHFEIFVNKKNVDIADETLAPDFFDHDGPGGKSIDRE